MLYYLIYYSIASYQSILNQKIENINNNTNSIQGDRNINRLQ